MQLFDEQKEEGSHKKYQVAQTNRFIRKSKSTIKENLLEVSLKETTTQSKSVDTILKSAELGQRFYVWILLESKKK